MNRVPAGSRGPPERDPEETGRAGDQATPRGHAWDSASRPAPGRRAHAHRNIPSHPPFHAHQCQRARGHPAQLNAQTLTERAPAPLWTRGGKSARAGTQPPRERTYNQFQELQQFQKLQEPRGETMPVQLGKNALSWVPEDQIEPQALAQIRNTASMPFIFGRRRRHRLRHDSRQDTPHLGRPAP